MNKSQEKHELMSVKEVAEFLRIHEMTIYKKIAPGSDEKFPIPAKRVGRAVRFERREVEKYIARI